MTNLRQLRPTTNHTDPTSAFICLDCGVPFVLPDTGQANDALVCSGCRRNLGVFATFDARRRERRWIITNGRPDQYQPH